MLVDRVRVARRFQRAIRIDHDLLDASAIDGFVCPPSSADALVSMARHIADTGQAAFTWTGPYGTGKSSLALAFSALLSGDEELRSKVAEQIGLSTANAIWDALGLGTRGWRVLPVVGRRADPSQVIGKALAHSGLVAAERAPAWDDESVVETLTSLARDEDDGYGGLVLFLDELGKFLEGAARQGSDIYVLQQLAEAASRTNGRLIVIGVLHQAFEEYANRISRDMRDEWAKVQGRFVDLSLTTAREEQLDLLSRAIRSDHPSDTPGAAATSTAGMLRRDRQDDAAHLARTLEACWPLHPVSAALVGPMSRTRFGQNQRSIFGFLSSAEQNGFNEFLANASDDELYTPDRLWDYLRANLEPAILASPDGHRWALATEALERCEANGGDGLHVRLLKTIGIVDFFRERSGLAASFELLQSSNPELSSTELRRALDDLATWSLIIYRKYLDAYSIFAGSDFNLDVAVSEAIEEIPEVDFDEVTSLAGIQPILAKRHYHSTGALRWFDVVVLPASEAMANRGRQPPRKGAIGQFALVVPLNGESTDDVEGLCRRIARQSGDYDVVAGTSESSWTMVDLAREMLALEHVAAHHPELAGDAVARREVQARLADLQGRVEAELRRSLDTAVWFRKHHQPRKLRYAELNMLASDLADGRFHQAPLLHNELLNRQQPSSSAIAAQNILLRALVLHETEPRLGIQGFPAEGGLYASLLEATGLHARADHRWRIVTPQESEGDPARLSPLWVAADSHLQSNRDHAVALHEILSIWRNPPYGVKDGLLPILVVSYIISQSDKISLYRDGVYRPKLEDVDVELLAKDPDVIQVRWMELSESARQILAGMAEVVRSLDNTAELEELEPLDVARGLVGIYDRLPSWTKRTSRLSANASRVRDLFKRARDPNRLLFNDIPTAVAVDGESSSQEPRLARVADALHEGLVELTQAYETMLSRLGSVLLAELDVPNRSPSSLAELRERASNTKGLSGDFRMEAFINRLEEFTGARSDVEGIVSLSTNKPPEKWVDADVDRAAVEIAGFSQRFLRLEVFTRLKNRPAKRRSLALFLGMENAAAPLHAEFSVADVDAPKVKELAEQISRSLGQYMEAHPSLVFAALANVAASMIQHGQQGEETTDSTDVEVFL